MAYPRRIRLSPVNVGLLSDGTFFTASPTRGRSHHYLATGNRSSCDPGLLAALRVARSRSPHVAVSHGGPGVWSWGEALVRARRSLTSGSPLGRDGPLGRARRELWSETGH
jgi:hypothetical protein